MQPAWLLCLSWHTKYSYTVIYIQLYCMFAAFQPCVRLLFLLWHTTCARYTLTGYLIIGIPVCHFIFVYHPDLHRICSIVNYSIRNNSAHKVLVGYAKIKSLTSSSRLYISLSNMWADSAVGTGRRSVILRYTMSLPHQSIGEVPLHKRQFRETGV